ncbi:MAG: PQQ-binding-like beta-propeller repeat protein [DPANN group archaeon]|nr:PQQ-binding-like beta-propeller repeat protein [DPANN group archaeon]
MTVGFMDKKKKKKKIILVIFILLILVLSLFIFYIGDTNNSATMTHTNGELIWPTYKHDFSRTGNLNLKEYEITDGLSMSTVSSNAPESINQEFFETGDNPSPIFVDVDNDGDDEVISYYKNVVYDKKAHTRPFRDFVMLIDYKENPTMLEKLEFGEVPFRRKWIFIPGGEVHTSFAAGDIDNDNDIEIVFGSDDNYLYALDGNDGKLEWKFKAEDKIRSSPAIGDIDSDGIQEIVFGSDDGYLYVLDGTNGKLKWKFKAGDKIQSSPTLFIDRGVQVTFGSDDKHIYVLDGYGKKICDFKAEGIIKSSPLIYNDNIVFSDVDGIIYYLSKSCKLNDKFKTGGNILGSGTIFKDQVIFAADDGMLYLTDPKGINELINVFSPSISTPVNIADNFIFLSTTDGELISVNDTGIYTHFKNNQSIDFSCSPSIGVIQKVLSYSCFYVQVDNYKNYAGIFVNSFMYLL